MEFNSATIAGDYHLRVAVWFFIEGRAVYVTCGHRHTTREAAAGCWFEWSPHVETCFVQAYLNSGRILATPTEDGQWFRDRELFRCPYDSNGRRVRPKASGLSGVKVSAQTHLNPPA